MLQDYLKRLFAMEQRADAREESFYPCLAELLERHAAAGGRHEMQVVTIPRKTEECLLDFQVWGERHRLAGYIEAKRPDADLEKVESTPQLLRYRATFPNLILTNFYEFRLYRRSHPAGRAKVTGRFVHEHLTVQEAEGGEAFFTLLDRFLDFATPRVHSASSLAVALARRASVLASRIAEILKCELASPGEEPSELAGAYQAFVQHLIAELKPEEFADLYAQTIAYGLLIARFQAGEQAEGGPAKPFARHTIVDLIPSGSGILRDVFRFLSVGTPPPEITWIVEDLIEMLATVPVRRILDRYYHENRGHDPIVHFYETFLHHYDRRLRKLRGVYYTPQAVVSYIVRSLDRLLETRLAKPLGLANPAVTLLDPAAGTLTFLIEAFRRAVETYSQAYGEAGAQALIQDHLLKNFYAFELMMAPYAIGHLKLLITLQEAGYPLGNQRCQLYLTNALESQDLEQTTFPFVAPLSREWRAAARVKNELPVTVILGNPPYSGTSANRGKDLDEWLKKDYVAADGHRSESYYRVDGESLGERNPKWLQDDYVKFLRWAQQKIDQQDEGLIGFVTNHGYLDNPTFRGLRHSLLRSFDQIYLLDLHGNQKRKETALDGSPDENVFEAIRQGVAIALLVKKSGLPKGVWHADLRGRAKEKVLWLLGHDVETTPWREIDPRPPACLFTPAAGDALLEEEYQRGLPLPEIFPEHTVGVVTARDKFAIDFAVEAFDSKVQALRGPKPEPLQHLGLKDTSTWKIKDAQKKARQDVTWRDDIQPILYRPFDRRWIFFADYLVERRRGFLMRQMLGGRNLGLIVPRQCKEEFGALVTDRLVAHKTVSAYDINSLFPLYLNPEGLFEKTEANLGPKFESFFRTTYGEEPVAEEVLGYVYAVLYSPPYRARFAPLLRRDFPRIPFPRDRRQFGALAALGRELIDLHLLRSPRLRPPLVRCQGEGRLQLACAKRLLRDYRPDERRVYVNEERQYFEGIAPEVWAYRIGGYQVLDHWLASRAGCTLKRQEIDDFCDAATALHLTLEIERRLGELYAGLAEGVERLSVLSEVGAATV